MNKQSIGLYRDYGLGILHNNPKLQMERKEKQITKIFKKVDYLSPSSYNLKLVDSLDVPSELCNILYKPNGKSKKLNDKSTYINKQSNHHPNVLKHLPKCIAKGILDTS